MEDPLAHWDQLEKKHKNLGHVDSVYSWTWRDDFITSDFNSLKAPETSLTDRIILLKAFYLSYFGELSPSANMGSLFVHIVATTPHISMSCSDDLIKFSPNGTRKLTGYNPPSNLNEVFTRFSNSNQEPAEMPDLPSDQVEAPKEPIQAGLVDEHQEAQPDPRVSHGPILGIKRITREDVITFRQAVVEAFRQVLSEQDTEEASVSYRSLHQTAFFMILFLMRRITKRSEDLLDALSRSNIHKHYTDMVQNPFGMTIPAPSSLFNNALDHVLSVQNQASRELYTIALWLLQTNTKGHQDKPVGLLDQTELGLEAILMATCMMHIAGAGLPLVTLFVAVKTLFNKSERATLEWLAYPELLPGIRKLVNLRSTQCQLVEDSVNIKLFPYCRLIHQNYHTDLGYKGNKKICYLMACLIDQHSPPVLGTGGATNAYWTNTMNKKLKSQIEDAARLMYSGTAEFILTAKYTGQINYGNKTSSGQTWAKPHVPVTANQDDSDSEDFSPVPIRPLSRH